MVKGYYILYFMTKSYTYQAIGQIFIKKFSETYKDTGLLKLENSNYNFKSNFKKETSILKDAAKPYIR